MTFDHTNDPRIDGEYGVQLDVAGRDRKRNLFYYVGDPDQGERVEFTKVQTGGQE